MELGIPTFVETPESGTISPQQRMNDLLEEIELADQLGLDVVAIGEHHRQGIRFFPRRTRRTPTH